MLGLGGVIGAGIFLASGITISRAGPAVIVSYLIGAVIMYLIVSALAEMSVANPVAGSFRVYAGEALGPLFGLTAGWMYWTSGVLTMSSEVTAAAIFARWWLPGIPLWVLSLAFSLLITGLNFLDVRGFGRIEAFLSALKVVALAGFALAGAAFIFGFFPGRPAAGLGNLTAHGGFWPRGLIGALSAMLMVMFSYAGTSVIGLAAAEARDPGKTVPQGIRVIIGAVVILYLGAITAVLAILPWRALGAGVSPFTAALDALGARWAGGVMNFVVLSAALSSMNTAMYGVSRMLYSLARDGLAPSGLSRVNRRGIPLNAIAVSSLVLAGAAALAYLLPRQAFIYITSSSGFVSMFNWATIAATHLRYRPMLERRLPDGLEHRTFGFPWTSRLGLVLVVGVILTVPLAPGQWVGLALGSTLFIVLAGTYYLTRLRRVPRQGTERRRMAPARDFMTRPERFPAGRRRKTIQLDRRGKESEEDGRREE